MSHTNFTAAIRCSHSIMKVNRDSDRLSTPWKFIGSAGSACPVYSGTHADACTAMLIVIAYLLCLRDWFTFSDRAESVSGCGALKPAKDYLGCRRQHLARALADIGIRTAKPRKYFCSTSSALMSWSRRSDVYSSRLVFAPKCRIDSRPCAPYAPG